MTGCLALDVGGTHVAGAAVNLERHQLVPGTYRYRALDGTAGADDIISDIARCAADVRARDNSVSGEDVLAVAMPGPFDYAAGVGQFSDVGKFDHLNGIDVGTGLRERLTWAPARIVFVNDAHAFGVGEHLAGPAAGGERTVVVTLGTGVGSAFLHDGIPVTSGPSVPPLGRAHLLSIAGRPLEDTVSRRALMNAYARTGRSQTVDVSEIAACARAGEVAAHAVFTNAFRALGGSLAPWLARFDAQVLVVGGSIARAFDLLAGPMQEGIGTAKPGLSLPVVQAGSENSAFIGAGWLATHTIAAAAQQASAS